MPLQYHQSDLSKLNFLVTGGAGFIGSHIVDYLIKHNAKHVTVVDNLSTGTTENLKQHFNSDRFTFKEIDINNTELMFNACEKVDYILHQAALGSVPRSIKDPLATHYSNATGFLNVLEAARLSKVKRLIYASSSSVYGDSEELPKKEHTIGNPKSHYAITKWMNEKYAELYVKLYGMEIIGLRYFNIFGPRQNPSGPYAAAIPLFILAALNGEVPTIFGNGEQSRDFTYVENAVQANIRALFVKPKEALTTYNIACGNQFTLNTVIQEIGRILETELRVNYKAERIGDILHSHADISKSTDLNYKPTIDLKSGLSETIKWYKQHPTKV